MSKRRALRLSGAHENNLRGVTVELPLGRLSCITGVSGSGKSSLVEDCLVAEAERRLAALAGRSARFPLPYRPALAAATLPHTILVSQGVLRWNARSTVGTATGILPRLRSLLLPLCEVRARSGEVVPPPDALRVAAWLGAHHASASVTVLADLGQRVLGPLGPRVAAAVARVPGLKLCVVETDAAPDPARAVLPGKLRSVIAKTQRDVWAVTGASISARATEEVAAALAQAFALARHAGAVGLFLEAPGVRRFVELSGALIDPSEPDLLFAPSETLLSFNSALSRSGRCPTCDGLGELDLIDRDALLGDAEMPLASGGLAIPFDAGSGRYRYFAPLAEEIAGLLVLHRLPPKARWHEIPAATRHALLEGTSEIIQPRAHDGRPRGRRKPFTGVLERVTRALAGSKAAGAEALTHLRRRSICPDCAGSRLSYPARRVHVGELSLDRVYGSSLDELRGWLDGRGRTATTPDGWSFLRRLLAHCHELGLGHLTLMRGTASVSGGEGQRLRIARGLATRLSPAAYVLDEPTRGLHAADAVHLSGALRGLLDDDSAVILVEHNPIMVRDADYVVELGPGAGTDGGRVTHEGPPRALLEPRRPDDSAARPRPIGWVELEDVNLRNIVHQSLRIPLGAITCVTGVSGSGKSTAVRDVLRPALEGWLRHRRTSSASYGRFAVTGAKIGSVLHVPQTALSDNPRSTVLSYLGLADEFRAWFAAASDGAVLGVGAAQLSANTVEGACPACDGLGREALDGVRRAIPCAACGDTGLKPHALFATLDGRNFGEWLTASSSTLGHDDRLPVRVRAAIHILAELGLGHLGMGRRVPSLSGGESQRLRIAAALLAHEARRGAAEHVLFLLDEPAAGLHLTDIRALHAALRRITDGQKHTVILVEHALYLIERADWIVDMGPGAASQGGSVLFQGSVADFLARAPATSPTRRALAGLPPTPRAPSESRKSGGDEVAAAAAALEHTDPSTDAAIADEDRADPALVHPTYLVGGELEAARTHDLLALLGAALPLYELFARDAVDPSGAPLTPLALDQQARAELAREPGALIGWYPATGLASGERVMWSDVRARVAEHMASGAWGWFDGGQVQRRRPASRGEGVDVSAVRMLMAPDLDVDSSIERACALGEGWVSIVRADGPQPTVVDFPLRTVSLDPTRVGARWQVPQIFDRTSDLSPCELCRGARTVERLADDLVLADRGRALGDPRLFTPMAAAALRATMRKRMMPAANRLAEAGLVNLTVRYSELGIAPRAAFWSGYPGKAFLAQGGDPAVKGDWYRWRGLVAYLLRQVWTVSDRAWSEAVVASRHPAPCPDCDGSGLGWEARLRHIDGVTLQEILMTWSVADLERWATRRTRARPDDANLSRLRNALALAIDAGVGRSPCGARLGELAPLARLLARLLACHHSELAGSTIVIRASTASERRAAAALLTRLRPTSSMRWTFDAAVGSPAVTSGRRRPRT